MLILLEDFKDYLIDRGYKGSTPQSYPRRIRKFFESGYSINDLIGAIDRLIDNYSHGGQCYDSKDHGNTVAALKRFKEYLCHIGKLSDGIESRDELHIKYEKGWSSFVRKDKYVSSYTISNDEIKISYKKGFVDDGVVVKKFSESEYNELIAIMTKYKNHLSNGGSAIKSFHGTEEAYSYSYGSRSASCCGNLFEDEKSSANAAAANIAFADWIKKYLKV